ncbi:uncharacterized protein JCM6883_003197 [Sporobolomyces salmoneus]|uniref:uncharacterized protein n=1 Tax=Sporobolomyces salmoneus TaxID=183962 RepID=UPI0031733680
MFPSKPAKATTHEPFRSHDEPDSMGDDGYIRRRTSVRSNDSQAHDSQDSHTGFAAAGAPIGRTGSFARSNSTRDGSATGIAAVDSPRHIGDGLDHDGYKPGMPIGLLAALGTPYAKKPIYKSRKAQILCPILTLVTLVVGVALLVFPILRAVAIHTLSVSVLHIDASNITFPTNNSFTLTLEGQVKKVGVFPAQIHFEEPVYVTWTAPEAPFTELHLGHFDLARIGVAAGHGRIKQLTQFSIDDEPAFARFTEYLITQEEFTWRLRSKNVKAVAFGFIGTASGLDFVKDLTLPAMANMTDISITDFQLPGDDPAGGISLSVQTKLTNPSAFGVEIGVLSVSLYYGDLLLGPAQTTGSVNLTAGVNYIHLVGRLLPYADDPAALAQLGTLFSAYLNGETIPVQARGLSIDLPGDQNIAWLTAGIQALVLNVPLRAPQGRIAPIKAITIEELSLGFDPANPYAPMANSSAVSAAFGLPFGFSLNIVQLQNQFSIIDNRTVVASLSSPYGSSQTTILSRNAGYTYGDISLDLPLAPLQIGPSYENHLAFDQFTYDLTTGNGSAFTLIGNTSAVTNTPLGQVELTDIAFAVPAGLVGLESLARYPTLIRSVDVTGGTADAILLNITVGLTNPSNLDLEVGDVTFQLFQEENFLGTTVLPDLHLTLGYQERPAVGYFQANNNAGSLATLAAFVAGNNTDLKISGFNGSTPTASLTQAFMALHLNATLPGLETRLLNYANLTVLPTTGTTNDLADSTVNLANPFSAALDITNIQANITAYGLFVGSIITPTDFPASGRARTDSPNLPFNLNLYPPDIFSLLRALAVDAGLPTEQIDGIVALGGYEYVPTAATASAQSARKRSLDLGALDVRSFEDRSASVGNETGLIFESDIQRLMKRDNIYTGFDLPSYVLRAFAGLDVNVELISSVNIGDYSTVLSYTQPGVPAYTDQTLTLLLPVLARPIVQKIVDEAALGIDTVMISDPTNTAFTAGLVGSLTNSGPFDAVISFPQGLTVAWNGQPLGQIAMPNISITGDVGADLNIAAAFAVADVGHLTEFTGYLLTEESFTWQIYGENLAVTALGITVDGISIMKNVVLSGMNGFKNLVTIESFDLPSNDPLGGIHLTLQTSLTNPSSVGVALSQIGFQNSFGSTIIGPAASSSAFDLNPKSTIALPLVGRLVPQSTEQGLADVSNIFNGFVHGVPSQLVVRGDYAGPSDCSWLNNGIKQLAIPVILPAAQNLQVINAITINRLTLQFSEENPWSPAFSTDDTVAAFSLPFAFPLDITNLASDITAGDPGSASRKRDPGDFALLSIPSNPAKTDVTARTILLQFQNVPFKSVNNGGFSSFITQVTDDESKTFTLHGAANTVAGTAVGALNLDDIAFSVSTSLLGLQGLNARPATVSDLDVFHGYPDYLQINVNAHLYNPSNITIGTGDVAFGLDFQSEQIGTADIANLVLVPGENNVPTAVHYQPRGGAAQAAGQLLLENYIQNVNSSTIIQGNSDTTPIASLKEALATIQLNTVIPAYDQNLITRAALTFPIDIGETSLANAIVTLQNPFTATINLLQVLANATYQDIYLGQVNEKLNPVFTTNGRSTADSQSLGFNLDTNPKNLIRFLEAVASANGVDLGILLPEFAYVLGLDSTESSVTTSVNTQPETCAPTGTTRTVQGLILAAVKNLRTDLTIQSDVKLDDYETPLNFVQRNVPTVLDDSVLYLTGIIGKTIVSRIVDQAELSFSAGNVYDLTNQGFTVGLTGSLLNAGPFDASIEFPEPLQVYYEGNYIADISLPAICSSGGSGVPNLQTTGVLTIHDKGKFTDFATDLLLNPSFTWNVRTEKLRVLALGTIFDNVVLSKDISFSAFDGLPGVTITNPDFPSDSANGIALDVGTAIPSRSNLGVQLGTATFTIGFMGSEIGDASANGLTLAPLAVTNAQLMGEITRQSGNGLKNLGILFSNFLQGQNQTLQVTGQQVVSPAQPNSPVDWLSAAFKKLTINVILPGHVYEIISAVTIQDLTVELTEASDDFNVPSSSNRTDATYKNPFGFSLTANQAGGDFYINFNGVDTALLALPVKKAVSAETSTGNDAALVLTFDDQPLKSLDNGAYQNFFDAVTNTANVAFNLHGGASVVATTNAGNIPITGIPFSVQTSLAGIQSLNARPTVVSNLDVYHGYPTYLEILADAALFNPSQITVITNEVVFGLEFMSQIIGTVNIGDLLLIPDENLLGTSVHYQPEGGAATAAGELLLENYIQNIVSDVAIVGTPNTTPYGSLSEALGKISINTQIPPINQLLVTSATLSFPIDIADTGIAEAKFTLSNPFTASINLQTLVANATYDTFYLGQINQQPLDPVISAGGHKNITSRELPFELTDDPKFLINFLIAVARANNVDLGILRQPFEFVLSQASTETSVTSKVNQGKETCTPTGTTKQVQQIILAAVANLKTDLGIQSQLALDDYVVDLTFAQRGVPTYLDDSVLYLTGLLGRTIVQNIVEGAVLAFTGGNVTDITDSGFKVALTGSLTNAGPFDALISFPNGADVFFMGGKIATLDIPPICSAGGSGVPDLSLDAELTITDEPAFVNFASYLLQNPQFTWNIQTNTLEVAALQTIFNNVTLSKNVTFDALNKLSPGVVLTDPDFPGDSSNPPGIRLTVDSEIPSPSNLGFELGTVNFIASYEGSEIGPVSGNDLTLPPKSTTELPLKGTIIYRDDPAGTAALGEVFSMFLLGENVPLTVTGDSVITPAQRSPVTWLSAAFKTLVLNVTLPGQRYDIISAITLQDLTVTITEPSQAYAALIQSNETDVTFKNPFGFSLTPIQAGGDFVINYNGAAGVLAVPVQNVIRSGTSTGQPADLVLAILEAAPFNAIDEGAYRAFFAAITLNNVVDFSLSGNASVLAKTAAGNIPISTIPFDNIGTTFPGIDGFGGKATIPETPVVIGGGSGDPFAPSSGGSFLRITLSVILDNPAPLILHTNLVSFQVIYMGALVGRAYVNPLDLYEGTNTLPSEFHYMPSNPGDETAQSLLTAYLETKDQIPITIQGDDSSSPYGSLDQGLAGLTLASSFPGQGIPLVHDIRIYLDLVQAFCSSNTSFDFSINNNLATYITVLRLTGTASQGATTYAEFDHVFSNPFTTDAGQNPGGYSEQVPAKLTQGAVGSLPLLANIGAGLDIDITVEVSIGGYVAPSLKYQQKNVPTSIVPTAGGNTLGGGLLGDLGGLLGELGQVATCVGGVLTIIPAAIGQLSNLPGFLTSLIGIPASLLNPVVSDVSSILSGVESGLSGVLSPVTSIVGGVTSVVGSVVSEVTSAAGSIVSEVTGDVGSIVSQVTSVLPSQAASVVGQVTSDLGAGASAAESVVTGVVGGATSAIGGALSGLGLRERDQLYTPQQPFATPTGSDSRPTAVYLSSSSTVTAPPVITPTVAPTALARPFGLNRPIERHEAVQIAAYQGGMDPIVFSNLLKKHGFEIGEDVQVWRQKDEEMKMKKRSLLKR